MSEVITNSFLSASLFLIHERTARRHDLIYPTSFHACVRRIKKDRRLSRCRSGYHCFSTSQSIKSHSVSKARAANFHSSSWPTASSGRRARDAIPNDSGSPLIYFSIRHRGDDAPRIIFRRRCQCDITKSNVHGSGRMRVSGNICQRLVLSRGITGSSWARACGGRRYSGSISVGGLGWDCGRFGGIVP